MTNEQAKEVLKVMYSIFQIDGLNTEDARNRYTNILQEFEPDVANDAIDKMCKELKRKPYPADIYDYCTDIKRQKNSNLSITEKNECMLCRGDGFIVRKDKDKRPWILYCHECQKGELYKYDGRELSKNKSPYYSEPISKYYTQEQIESIKAKNLFRDRTVKPPPQELKKMLGVLGLRM